MMNDFQTKLKEALKNAHEPIDDKALQSIEAPYKWEGMSDKALTAMYVNKTEHNLSEKTTLKAQAIVDKLTARISENNEWTSSQIVDPVNSINECGFSPSRSLNIYNAIKKEGILGGNGIGKLAVLRWISAPHTRVQKVAKVLDEKYMGVERIYLSREEGLTIVKMAKDGKTLNEITKCLAIERSKIPYQPSDFAMVKGHVRAKMKAEGFDVNENTASPQEITAKGFIPIERKQEEMRVEIEPIKKMKEEVFCKPTPTEQPQTSTERPQSATDKIIDTLSETIVAQAQLLKVKDKYIKSLEKMAFAHIPKLYDRENSDNNL